MIEHLDEDGKPCTRHAPATDVLLAWAAVGSRISGFHHDSASKIQSMLMAVEEALELLGADRSDVRHQLDIANTALRDLHGLLAENRALAKAPQRKRVPVAELLSRAAARNGVQLRGELGSDAAHVAPPSIVHALALLLDQAAGPAQSARLVDVVVAGSADAIDIEIRGEVASKPASNTNEAITAATFLLAREDGQLRCTPSGFRVQLPTSSRSAGDKP